MSALPCVPRDKQFKAHLRCLWLIRAKVSWDAEDFKLGYFPVASLGSSLYLKAVWETAVLISIACSRQAADSFLHHPEIEFMLFTMLVQPNKMLGV